MNEKEQEEYLQEYKKEKEKGVLFFPDILFKDAVVSLLMFFILAGLAYFLGAPLEDRANPANTSFTPRPEWYFLFLFQLLKYFPGKLEVIGAIIIPTIVLSLLFFLPLIDRGPKRHFKDRLTVTGITGVIVAGMVGLTILAVREAPPPSVTVEGDPVAALYARNCSACHGASIEVKPGVNLHNVIAQGNHEGMPAWSGDLTSDQIDALAGFITSPGGSQLFNQNCGSCHKVEQLVEASPLDLNEALEKGTAYPPHAGAQVPDWSRDLSDAERTSLLNFLVAPDGQRLFAINCSPCHGSSVPFSGSNEELVQVISQGGKHLDMPAWKDFLTSDQIDQLSRYIVDPASAPDSQPAYQQLCSPCHGQFVPKAETAEAARTVIESGGPHRVMPVWGKVLTSEQLNALVSFTQQSSQGDSTAAGQKLFSENCTACHGRLGEGGPNPSRPGDIIAPISSAEYLKTRDDATLTAIISQGQPDFGMSPFASADGGSLDQEDIEAIVKYIRSWEAKPPVDQLPETLAPQPTETPPQAPTSVPVTVNPSFSGDILPIFAAKCALCHGFLGGWSAKDFASVMQSGDNSPVILPGDPEGSLLMQKLLGTQILGGSMPPGTPLSQDQIDLIKAWIAAGALDN